MNIGVNVTVRRVFWRIGSKGWLLCFFRHGPRANGIIYDERRGRVDIGEVVFDGVSAVFRGETTVFVISRNGSVVKTGDIILEAAIKTKETIKANSVSLFLEDEN